MLKVGLRRSFKIQNDITIYQSVQWRDILLNCMPPIHIFKLRACYALL